ncbi:MAG: HAMP domain-containing histidine kinase [Candidatus Azobacteroides sp.]|nr:HAMP domain-containing histidine kinase [Candidatus Azobacteroides sp.]
MFRKYKSGKTYRYFFITTAIIIAIASVGVTNSLVNELKEEERKKIEIWAESVTLISSQTVFEDLNPNIFNAADSIISMYDNLLLKIIQSNTTIPLILTDDSGNEIFSRNIRGVKTKEEIEAFRKKRDPIIVRLDENTVQYVYYDDSTVLKQLQLFPFVQLTVVFIFIIISFLALNSAKKAEQNKVWVGLSKETAHQLGTPISSLMAWIEYLKNKNTNPGLLNEMDKDVQRLRTIAERFSKIGSNPEQEPMDLQEAVVRAVEYMEKRISSKVSITTVMPKEPIGVLMNESLFGWILENLIKNAVDAMDGQGSIEIQSFRKGQRVIMDISDTGRGIPKSKFNAIFQPGFTTKARGWGLGLSLTKRIIESYRKGKIYVYKSEQGKGTTFRIEFNPYSPR